MKFGSASYVLWNFSFVFALTVLLRSSPPMAFASEFIPSAAAPLHADDQGLDQVFDGFLRSVVGQGQGQDQVDFSFDHPCPGTSGWTCSDDETCCPFGVGDYMCCYNTSVPGSTCCGDGCCTDHEECCADREGEACCIQQDTFCVPDQLPTYPARCCPRWTVGCNVGSVGCCDPARPWQWTVEAQQREAQTRATGERDANRLRTVSSRFLEKEEIPSSASVNVVDDSGAQGLTAAGPTVYALFITGLFGLQLLHIDPASGNTLNKVKVTGMDNNPAGESTRDFLFSSRHKVFYYLDANFTANGGVRPTKGRAIYLYTVDANTGKSSKRTVTGATDYPAGQTMAADGETIIMATKGGWSGDKFTKWNYYTVQPTTGAATLVGSVSRGASEDAAGFYAGYHRACSKDGKTVYRLGYKEVTMQRTQGIDIVKLAGESTSVMWHDELSPGHDYYMSLDRYDFAHQLSAANESFLSLAPSKDNPKRELDVVQWVVDSNNLTVVGKLGNAHPPRVSQLGDLGYLGTYINGKTYVAMVVQDGATMFGDVWALATVDMASGKTAVMPIQPRAMSGTMSVSGVGYA